MKSVDKTFVRVYRQDNNVQLKKLLFLLIVLFCPFQYIHVSAFFMIRVIPSYES